jgi:hypothetical protein
MIPSILLIRSNKKRFVTLTKKRNLKIGARKDLDVIVNHPHFHENTLILGPGAQQGPSTTVAKAKSYLFFSNYTFRMEDFNVRMFPMKEPLMVLLIIAAMISSLTYCLTDRRPFSVGQDWTPIVLPAGGIYGFCRQDRSHRQGVRFILDVVKPQPYRLVFFTGGRGDGATVTLSLNGTTIGNPLLLPTGWGKETSIPLPSGEVRVGENIIEVLPAGTSAGIEGWGISDIRALPIGKPDLYILDSNTHEPGIILEALNKQNISGQELARYFNIVSSWKPTSPSEDTLFNKDDILRKIEQRMKYKLHTVAFDVRSKKILGDTAAIRELLDETIGWIPDDWAEGWIIFHELCQ